MSNIEVLINTLATDAAVIEEPNGTISSVAGIFPKADFLWSLINLGETNCGDLARRLFFIWTGYVVVRCIYNLYFHPLSKIPGPWLAAMTPLCDFWYDAVKNGNYLWEIQKMHEKYGKTDPFHYSYQQTSSGGLLHRLLIVIDIGPIVRINPNEVHIDDPEYYQNVYVGGTHRINKDSSTVAGFGVPASVAATVNHAQHRSRRGYMNPYFAKRSIVSMEPQIHERITAMLNRLDGARKDGTKISLDLAFSAMTADIITQRFFGYHYDYLSIPSLVSPIREAFKGVSEIFHWTRFVPWAIRYLKKLPIPVIRLILPPVAELLVLQEDIKINIKNKLASENNSPQSKSIIIEALGDSHVPAQERTMERLVDEGQVIIFAGTETSSRSLAVGMFYLLANKSLVNRALAELSRVDHIPDEELTMKDLETLPFMTGIVKEAIRLSYGPITRLPRVFTHETLQYKDHAIPPGTPVSQSTYFVHTNPKCFVDPFTFNPDRWVEAAKAGFPLERYLTSFTKGSRQCLGIGLAHAELYLTFTRVLRNFDMDLVNTSIADVQVHNVLIIGQPKLEKDKGEGQGEVEVMVTRKLRP
ncbi:trichodiene oxygenase [Colletotrichum tamarilloi]|uniref:Trichodiene oxygenase n=1 Tax=Colletotrichum tamarilloi TaxID=1209934 RepID=A0ABQ9R1T2_9PEZI|nr:trichodiene oxygenase [Colletotrichum tamarilloi]KAK1492450.1 trichodiene oxygenase [Colletotrichum tamarilloi]